MNKLKSYILPLAIVLGLLLHSWCTALSFLVPFIIFAILLLTFSAVDIRSLRLTWLCVWLMLFQLVVSTASYAMLRSFGASAVVAEGVLIGVLCPVASSVAVVSCMLGADRRTVTAYTVYGNLMVALAAPVCFSFIGRQQAMPFMQSLWLVFSRVGTVIGLPFFLSWAVQAWWPAAHDWLGRWRGLAFYLWTLALLFTLGQTIDFIFLHGSGHWDSILWLGAAALFYCALQFGFGKWLGRHYGDSISGGQLLGQKNTAMGIWMANYYLSPLSSVFLAFYSVCQNLFNSWQLWRANNSNYNKN